MEIISPVDWQVGHVWPLSGNWSVHASSAGNTSSTLRGGGVGGVLSSCLSSFFKTVDRAMGAGGGGARK